MTADTKTHGAPARLIFIALIVGAAAGLTANGVASGSERLLWFVRNISEPIGQLWLRGLFMVVVPLIFSTMALGVVNLGQLHSLGRVLAKTFGLFLLGTAAAATIGLLLVNTARPGAGLPPDLTARVMAEYEGEAQQRTAAGTGFGVNTLVNIIPRNPVEAAARGDYLAIIFFALAFGAALAGVAREKAQALTGVLEGIAEVMIRLIGYVMKVAPLGVAMLVFSTMSRFGLSLLRALAFYIVVVISGLVIHAVVTLSAFVRIGARRSPVWFFKKTWVIVVTAFSTSSSNAMLPTTMRVTEEELGVPRPITGFVLPLGATANMHGTALFEGVTVIFLAQVFGVHLSLASQLVVIVMAVIAAIGTAGVPGGSIPLLVMVLETVGVPGQGVALILGVDRLLDMSRTTLNVMGDVATALCVARSEKLTT